MKNALKRSFMKHKIKLLIISILLSFLLIPLLIYFTYFPTVINATITNLTIIILVSVFVLTAIFSLLLINKDDNEYYFILLQILIFVFMISAIPNLRLEAMSYHDPYYYTVTTLNIIQYNTLNPILQNWYPTIDQQLHWPVLELLTSHLVMISKIDVTQFGKFLLPFLSTISFLFIFILTKNISKDNRIALLSAIIVTLNGIWIFYYSEFHPQAFASMIFLIMIYFYFKYKNTKNMIFGMLMLITMLIFVLSHHFSSLFLAVFAVLFVITTFVLSHVNFNNNFNLMINEIKDYNFWILIAVSSITYHIFGYFSFISSIFSESVNINPSVNVITTGANVPLLVTFLSATKWIIFLLAIPSIYLILKTVKNISFERSISLKLKNEFIFLLLFILFFAAGILGSTILKVPSDRIIIFFYLFASFFAAMSFFKYYDNTNGKKKYIKAILIIIIFIPLFSGIFNSQSPAYFFKDSGIDTFYWASNDLSSYNSFQNGGNWIKNYTNSSQYYATEFDTRTLVFFYGQIGSLAYLQPHSKNYELKDFKTGYVVINPNIPYDYSNNFNKTTYVENINVIFFDGNVLVGQK